MHFTTLISGLTALAFTKSATAVVIRTGGICSNVLYADFAPLANWPAAQAFCSSAYGVSTVTMTMTTILSSVSVETASASDFETVTVTETSTAITSTLTPVKAKRSKCRSVSVKQSAPASYSASSTLSSIATISSAGSTRSSIATGPSASSDEDNLCSSLKSGPSSIAEAVCSCYIETPVTVTATITSVVSGIATATPQATGTVTITTTYIVTAATSTTSESSSSTGSSTSSASSPVITSTTSQYQANNGLLFELTYNSLYGATDDNIIVQMEQPDFQACVEECALTFNCAYLLYVESTDYPTAKQCYLLTNDEPGFGTGYLDIDTAKLIGG
ncbi:hypothetical protein SCARD494_05754 [Seiridium cardinale]